MEEGPSSPSPIHPLLLGAVHAAPRLVRPVVGLEQLVEVDARVEGFAVVDLELAKRALRSGELLHRAHRPPRLPVRGREAVRNELSLEDLDRRRGRRRLDGVAIEGKVGVALRLRRGRLLGNLLGRLL